MPKTLSLEALKSALTKINEWHANTPLLLVLSRQKPGNSGEVSGGAAAVREAYDDLFNLERIGIADTGRKYYLHLCHGGAEDPPSALKKPTTNYGKTHQRIVKDTFGQKFLTRLSEGRYRLNPDFAAKAGEYLGLPGKLDLKPLVLFYYWSSCEGAATIGDLWKRFATLYGLDKAPFKDLFTCSGTDEAIPFGPNDLTGSLEVKRLFLPSEYGVDGFGPDFWKRFRTSLQRHLKDIKWHGETDDLTASITAALMVDQALFLLGAPGTGKTTIVEQAVLPALREAHGSQNPVRFLKYPITQKTSETDLFGFQSLDGSWVAGPLTRELLVPYDSEAPRSPGDDDAEDDEAQGADPELKIPRLLFFDEANRIDIEALLAPIQSMLDKLQKRMEPSTVPLGQTEYTLPNRVWRIFAGNSPVSDLGRREQSRPLKRRMSVVVPPDPMATVIGSADSFRRLVLDRLELSSQSGDPEISQPTFALFSVYKDNPERVEDLRVVMEAVRELPRVAMTVGLVETVLLRTASLHALGREAPLDNALSMSLTGLLCGDTGKIESIRDIAQARGFPKFARDIQNHILANQAEMALETDPVL
jgi:MoxR-like ATPase